MSAFQGISYYFLNADCQNLLKSVFCFFFFLKYVCACIYLGARGGEKKALDPLELELLVVVSLHVVAEN